jgi:WD40 repeat protein|eukprot:COSAG06_NODE_6332_length_2980_cov_2.149254_2_plen_146_part_00
MESALIVCVGLQSIGQHKDIVTTLALGEDGGTLVRFILATKQQPQDTPDVKAPHWCLPAQVTGSLDGTVMVWDVSPFKEPRVSKHPRAVLYGHRDEITCTAINTDLGIVASTAKDGSCLIHKAYNGQYVRCIRNPKLAPQVYQHH